MIRLLTAADIPAAMSLKQAAGWNQTEQDWANVLAIEPEGCFGFELEGALTATATAVCYGRELAWIGMVLTAPEFRGRGFARRLMEAALAWLADRGVRCVKLDATGMGRPLYAKLGFVDECPVERWLWGRLPACGGLSGRLQEGRDDALDHLAFGADRARVLDRIAVESAFVKDGGYALGRPGSTAFYLGPCIARTPEAASSLIDAILARHAGEPVYWDLLPDNGDAVRLAEVRGFRRVRSLVRMARPPMAFGRAEYIYAIAGFEFG